MLEDTLIGIEPSKLRMLADVTEHWLGEGCEYTTIIAYVQEGMDVEAGGVYVVYHDAEADPEDGIREAPEEFLATEEGQEYLETNVRCDVFNWGDAIARIPQETLERHGVRQILVPFANANVRLLDHDEEVGGSKTQRTSSITAQWKPIECS